MTVKKAMIYCNRSFSPVLRGKVYQNSGPKRATPANLPFFFFALRLPIKRIVGYGHRSSVKKGGVPSSTDTLFHGDRGEKGRLQMKNHRVLELSIVSIYFDTKS